MNEPQAFRTAPARRSAAAPPSQTADTPVPYAPPAEQPLLVVRLPNWVSLTQGLLRAIPHLKAGAPVELVPPARRGGTWHLDTRPTAGRRLPATGAARFRTGHALRREFFLLPARPLATTHLHQVGGTAGTRSRLTFRLGAAVAGQPGYYMLVAVLTRGPVTHCARGHLFTPETSYYAPTRPGRAVCRVCERAREQARRAGAPPGVAHQ